MMLLSTEIAASALIAPVLASFCALAFVVYLVQKVMAKDPGNQQMRDISGYVQEGATAFLRREYYWVSFFVIGFAVVLIVLGPSLNLPWETAIAGLFGAIASATAGYIGMWIATRCNCRTTQGAVNGYKDGKESALREALSIAVSGGAVMGFSVVGISLLGLAIVAWLFPDPRVINGYAMGASTVALFARAGGGIFTKGADMGADLVGKVEAGIPEDDPRNPATIADNVGDNVGDVAGLGADLLESYVESIIAAIAIGFAATMALSLPTDAIQQAARDFEFSITVMPLMIASAGILASIVGVFVIKYLGRSNAQAALMNGTYVAAGLAIFATAIIVGVYGVDPATVSQIEGLEWSYGKWGPFWASLAGIVSGIAVGFVSEYYTSSRFQPVREIAKDSQMGPAINVTQGIAVGMMSTAGPILVLVAAVFVAYTLCGYYGVAMAALGMLATTGIIVTVDSYGPIADNAGGIAEMTDDLDETIREVTDNLDSVGNTTAAIGKGFAIGSAALAALALLSAFMQTARVEVARLDDVYVIGGLMIGAMLPYFFSALLFSAVSKCAFEMIEEVRRQIREIPGIMERKAKPEYAKCVDISTHSAIQGMLLPGIIAVMVPIVFGVIPVLLFDSPEIGQKLLAGVLVGSLVSGVMLGLQAANSGGAMDNAKKYIEEGNYGGKGSEAHKAAVIGDTVGDPLKDTVGPSINILIKLMAVISLVIAPVMAS